MTNIIKEIKKNDWRTRIIEEYDQETNKLVKETIFGMKKDKEVIRSIHEYDKNTGKQIKYIWYGNYGDENIKKIRRITEYDKDTGNQIKEISFYDYEKQIINCIFEWDKHTGERIKHIDYFYDTKYILDIPKNITHIEENIYDKDTGRLMKEIRRKPDGSIESIKEHRIDKVILIERFEEIKKAPDYIRSRFSDVEDVNLELEDIEENEDNADLIEEKNNDKDDALSDIETECSNLYPTRDKLTHTKNITTEEKEKITEFLSSMDDDLYALIDKDSIEDNSGSIDDFDCSVDKLINYCKDNDIHIVEEIEAEKNWDEEK